MKYNKKKGTVAAACVCAAAAITVASFMPMSARAASTSFLPMDTALAGISVPLNNYYASSMEPEKELKEFLANKTSVSSNTAESQPGEETQETTDQQENGETDTAEGETETAAETTAESTEAEETTAAETEEASPYDTIAITRVTNYVNIRDAATTEGNVVGKIYNNAAATILDTVDGEDGQWYYIESGNVKGYMKAEFFVTGQEAETIAKEVGTVWARTTAVTLKLREEPSTDSRVLTLLAQGETYLVSEENIVNEAGESFIKVLVNAGETEEDNLVGYISSDYADVYVEFEEAISKEEEEAELARIEQLKEEEEAARKRMEEEKKRQEEASKAAATTTQTTTTQAPSTTAAESSTAAAGSSEGTTQAQTETTTQAQTTTEAPTTQAETQAPSSGSSATRDAIVARAQQFVGNLAYVWGGTSLSSGVDCSGFTYAIFREYGITLPRDSRSQAAGGTSISRGELQAGDLVFYANSSGTINHVGLYIGGGQIVHAANRETCVRISSVDYATPVKYARYIN